MLITLERCKPLLPGIGAPPSRQLEYGKSFSYLHLRKLLQFLAPLRKPVKLEAYDYTSIRYVTVDIKEHSFSESWSLTTTVHLLAPLKNVEAVKGKLIITLQTDFAKVQQAFPVKVSANQDGEYIFSKSFNIAKVFRY